MSEGQHEQQQHQTHAQWVHTGGGALLSYVSTIWGRQILCRQTSCALSKTQPTGKRVSFRLMPVRRRQVVPNACAPSESSSSATSSTETTISSLPSSWEPMRQLSRAAKFALASFIFILQIGGEAGYCLGRDEKYVKGVTLTDQGVNTTLPSWEADLHRENSTNEVGGKVLRIVADVGKKVLPVAVVTALVVYTLKRLVKKAQDKQLRDFQAQLQSFSSMLDIDTAALEHANKKLGENSTAGATSAARKFKKGSVKNEIKNEVLSDDLASKVRLDLFRAGGGANASASEKSAGTRVEHVPLAVDEIVPENEFEKVVQQCLLHEVKSANPGETAKAALAKMEQAREKGGFTQEQALATYSSFLSKLLSSFIDRAAIHLNSDDRDSIKLLSELATLMSSAHAIAKARGNGQVPPAPKYIGRHAGEERIREELYRRYAVFCLSSEERVRNDLQSLVDMQNMLSVSDAHAETINKEIAKGMFQVAVSAAMADGSLDESSRDALEKLKSSFGDFLEGEAADSIMSEVAIMRAMYTLQQLLKEQGVSEDDVREVRKMCGELGVDIDEMLMNADALGDALGPEAQQFVESLRALLMKDESAKDDSVLTTAVAVEGGSADSTDNSAKGQNVSKNSGRDDKR